MHFTYKTPEGSLQQGDVLQISPELKKVLNEFHAYYSDHPDYRYLVVLTQSCDLVRREGGKCKSPYITVAVVRPIKTAIVREFKKFQRSSIEKECNVCGNQVEPNMVAFLRRLLNNNHPDYFYLAESISGKLTLPGPHVVFLSLSVALKAGEHYCKCLSARVGQLEQIFQAKLGWLVGTHYSRVGTQDMADVVGKTKFDEITRDLLNDYCRFSSELGLRLLKNARQAKKARGDIGPLSDNDIDDVLDKAQSEKENRRRQFAQVVLDYVKDVVTIQPDDADRLLNALVNRPELSEYLRK